ncbi:hypothetical protein PoB_007440300 [Plakobranchus ocellatus]|uniref:Uncharacterized protein n=1 Tax=Plakobranchus ocellatus TaxID=259542 RepID=A0AAV4DUE0_9GAST|nr:hypothetical protein PoB_007440300 [Plakobranchus ocellatus]
MRISRTITFKMTTLATSNAYSRRFLTPVLAVAIALALIAAHRERDVRSYTKCQNYTPNGGCGSSTGIDPSPIQRKLTSRLDNVDQRCPPFSGEGNGQRCMLVSDSHYCLAVTTSTPGIHPSPIRVAPHGKQGARTVGWASQLFLAP